MEVRWIGYVGLVAFALAWIPQSWETVREGRCAANRSFLALAAVGSLALTAYALRQGDPVFSLLNGLTTAGAAMNLLYSLFPRIRTPKPSRP
ncbi:MAG: lipid-A-disaccharide synthase N-terminal domain-containing protein [Elusimicrobia bacterium]|nr:lipid-A-disaccharide synthase N-terminal domain-containing protein [Elusimicrobiota bacterium]